MGASVRFSCLGLPLWHSRNQLGRCATWSVVVSDGYRHVFLGDDRGVADGKHARLPCDHDAWVDADVVDGRDILSHSIIGGADASFGQVLLGGVMRANPLSYTVVELRRLMYPAVDYASHGFAPSHGMCWIVTIGFAMVTTFIAWRLMRGSHRVDVLV